MASNRYSIDDLWKKESLHSDARYIDFCEIIDAACRQQVADILSRARNHAIEKSDIVSANLQQLGARKCRERKWAEATEMYNRSVCAAENGSSVLQRAYKARGRTFARRGMSNAAAIDIELSGQSASVKRRSDRIRNQKLSNTADSMERVFNPNKILPGLSDRVQVKNDLKYGRHVVARRGIEVGQTIAMDRPFASVCVQSDASNKQAYCITCLREDANFIPCANCPHVMFCSQTCLDTNQTHLLECQSFLHQLTSRTMKLAIQLVLIGMQHFSSVDKLIAFVEGVVNKSPNDPNDLSNKTFPDYTVFLNLHCVPKEIYIKLAYEAIEFLKTLPKVQSYFHSDAAQRFLVHLLIHHMGIIRMNAWDYTSGWTENVHIKYVHSSISLFNHSCAPNAFYNIQDNVAKLIMVRPAKRGQQIFINYLGDQVDETRHNRRRTLSDEWKFDCECDRCSPVANRREQMASVQELLNDANFKYYQKHRKDVQLPNGNERGNHLKSICVQILNKYGHMWSNHLNDVINSFMAMNINSGA